MTKKTMQKIGGFLLATSGVWYFICKMTKPYPDLEFLEFFCIISGQTVLSGIVIFFGVLITLSACDL